MQVFLEVTTCGLFAFSPKLRSPPSSSYHDNWAKVEACEGSLKKRYGKASDAYTLKTMNVCTSAQSGVHLPHQCKSRTNTNVY